MKKFTVAVLGCGNRGAQTYGALMYARKEQFEVVALCDVNTVRLATFGDRFGVPEKDRFTDEDVFLSEKRADLLVIATMDRDHVREGVRALALGYDLLLEKPITDNKKECEELLAAQKKYGGKVLVCHVLRYAPAFRKAAELLKSGAIGKLVSIQALEQVAFWHVAHSYVRGNWRRLDETAPMILAKCCHDLDLLQYYAGSRAVSVSSVGSLAWFKPENAPEGAADRCVFCKYIESCPYSAKKIYIDTYRAQGSPAQALWPHTQVSCAYPMSEEELYKALREGPYGRCVYRCDNDVVDHQLVNIRFENGVEASLTMMGFTAGCGRIVRFFGSHGEIVLDEIENFVKLKPFGGEEQTFAITDLGEVLSGHGGGDDGLVGDLYAVLSGETLPATSLEASVESHLIAYAAERSRLKGGELVPVHEE